MRGMFFCWTFVWLFGLNESALQVVAVQSAKPVAKPLVLLGQRPFQMLPVLLREEVSEIVRESVVEPIQQHALAVEAAVSLGESLVPAHQRARRIIPTLQPAINHTLIRMALQSQVCDCLRSVFGDNFLTQHWLTLCLGARKAASLQEQQPASSASVSASARQSAAHAPVGIGNNDNQGAFSANAQWLAAFLATRAPGEEVLFRQIRNQHESDQDVTVSDAVIIDLIEEAEAAVEVEVFRDKVVACKRG
jgi:hypothetical protein